MKRVLDGSIKLRDALDFIQWRFVHKPSIFFNGLLFTDADHITWSLITETFLHREYTPSGFEIAPDDTVVDIGAHRGVFVGYAAKKTKEEIIAVEPHYENFKILEKFIRENQLTNVRAMNCALGATNGTTKLYLSESSRHSVTGFDQATGQGLTEHIVVPSISLEALLSSFAHIGFLKMDCEGAEYEILEKTSESTLDKIKKLSMEIHNIDNKQTFDNLFTKLRSSFNVVDFQKKSKTIGIVNARKFRH
jgi:FkbM family methyltransferase